MCCSKRRAKRAPSGGSSTCPRTRCALGEHVGDGGRAPAGAWVQPHTQRACPCQPRPHATACCSRMSAPLRRVQRPPSAASAAAAGGTRQAHGGHAPQPGPQVYGETSLGLEEGLQEHAMLDPTNPYSAAKAGAEMMCKAYQTRCAWGAAPHLLVRLHALLATAACAALHQQERRIGPARRARPPPLPWRRALPPPPPTPQLQDAHHHHARQQRVWPPPIPREAHPQVHHPCEPRRRPAHPRQRRRVALLPVCRGRRARV